MDILILKQNYNGLNKTWKLNSYHKKMYSFGKSLKNDIKSFDPNHNEIEGAFIFTNNEWLYQPLVSEDDTTVNLTNITNFNVDKSGFILSKKENLDLFNFFYNIQSSQNGEEYILILKKSNIKTFIPLFLTVKEYEKSYFNSNLSLTQLSTEWSKIENQSSETYIKKIKLSKNDLSIYQTTNNKNGFKIASTVTVTLFLLILLSNFRNENNKTILNTSSPQFVQQVLKTDFKKVKKKIQENKTAVASNQNSNSQTNESPKGSTSSLFFKGNQNQRVSNLLSKISALSARSKNLIISNGVKAGTEKSGHALSVLGSINQKGLSFNGKQVGEDGQLTKFGTISGSLKNTGGLAAIHSNKSGIGLLDDESEISGGLDKDVIAEVIRSNLGQILYCYERQLSASPDLFGKVSVKFTIGSSGSVETQKIGDSSLRNNTVENCILSKVSKWNFPKPKGGTQVLVTYPFLFKSTQ